TKLAQIDAARKQYAEAADASASDADTSIKRLNDELQALQTNIELRKKQIVALASDPGRKAEAKQREVTIDAKAREVEDLKHVLALSQSAFEANRNKLRDAQTASEQAVASSARLEEINRQRDTLERQLEQSKREWDQRKEQVDRAIEPVEPTEADIRSLGTGDSHFWRVTYALSAGGGIFTVFAIWILITLLGAARQ